MKNTKIKYLYIFAVLMLSTVFTACSSNSEEKEDNKIGVIIQEVKENTDEEQISFSGTIEASKTTSLSFSVIGTVVQTYFEEGTMVQKGSLLAKINSETYSSAYDIALSSLKQAEDAYKRLEPMYKNGTYPEIKMVELETGLQQAKSNAAIMKKNLDDCSLYANATGVVGKKLIEPGMSAIPGNPSFIIVDINKVFVKVPIPENEISKIKKGNKAKIQITALDEVYREGIIEEIGVMANPFSHTYDIKIALNNTNLQIKPGMVCNVDLTGLEKRTNLIIPSNSVLVDEEGINYVYVTNSDLSKAIKKEVSIGSFTKKNLEILYGLTKEDKVVISGYHKLYNKAPIKILKYSNN
ncbi:MAG: efflux RND transporter periplasmic adaptor subunit [bacterium]